MALWAAGKGAAADARSDAARISRPGRARQWCRQAPWAPPSGTTDCMPSGTGPGGECGGTSGSSDAARCRQAAATWPICLTIGPSQPHQRRHDRQYGCSRCHGGCWCRCGGLPARAAACQWVGGVLGEGAKCRRTGRRTRTQRNRQQGAGRAPRHALRTCYVVMPCVASPGAAACGQQVDGEVGRRRSCGRCGLVGMRPLPNGHIPSMHHTYAACQ